MIAVVCEEPGRLAVIDRPRPEPASGEVLVRIRRIGICGTDYHIVRGTQPYLSYPRIMGHELAGEVVTGLADGPVPGTPVCIIPYLSCGECRACRRGRENCCQRLEVLGVHRDGGLTEYLAVPARFLVDVTGLTLDQAAMVEFLAIGHHAVARADLGPADRALVVGAGPIGMAVALFAAMRGAVVTVLDTNADRAAFCVDALGAAHGIAADERADARLAGLSDGDGFDAVFDATGSARAIEAGFARVAHGGVFVLVSVVSAPITFDDPAFHARETALLGSRNATRADFDAVIAAIRAGRVPTDRLHTHGTPLSALPDHFADWMLPASGVIKAIVTT